MDTPAFNGRWLLSGLVVLLVVSLIASLTGNNVPSAPRGTLLPRQGSTTVYYASQKKNGAPISLTLIRNPQFAPDLGMPSRTKLYSLKYWSQGYAVQGYVVVPPSRGPMPLEVNLHGGYMLPAGLHTNKYAETQSDAELWTSNSFITFLPNYEGYGLSQGDVRGGYGDYLDTENGLRALFRVFGPKIQGNHTYLYGVSLGGFVAMKLAESDPGVKALVLLSPFPGAEAFVSWVESRPSQQIDEVDRNDVSAMLKQEGANPRASWYLSNSLGDSKIKIPVLIIGGEKDPIIPPAMLRQLKGTLSKNDPNVELAFFPGGHAPVGMRETEMITYFMNSH
ncbi:alpha/beta hydrolase family protein [Sulfobacillus harzensis]|uniref:Peptidase S9 prolyl oligopeptidase catalytic domain-containing protein n=1 Tax=Sulfobacillus harzensis TaxID=2729629 RepID=A0A7Y0L1Y9_9FIRM|nr:alpha/beta hydrolase [Sulfobacillus harzensis]NMP21807.1 hypothetical protein [Sulfobacillus harzensis]